MATYTSPEEVETEEEVDSVRRPTLGEINAAARHGAAARAKLALKDK